LIVPLADLAAQCASIREEIDAAIRSVLDSGRFILGPQVAEVEQAIASHCGARYGVGVNSGTDALLLGLRAVGIGPGDEVITTPFTFVATIEAIAHVGATPVFADIDLRTFNLDPEAAAGKIGARTRAIMPVDLFGQMADRDAFGALARRHGLKLIYDSAQAIGCRYHGRPLGVDGDAVTLSFFPTKNLGALGDGGMVLTNDPDVAERVRRLRFHGSGGDYAYDLIGYCSRLDALQAAVLQVKLRHLDEWNETRRRHAARYRECLAECGCTLPFEAPGMYHTYHQFTIRHPERDRLRQHLTDAGVQSGIYYPSPLHVQPAYSHLGYKQGDFPYAEQAAREVLSLPVHPNLTDEQVEHVCQALRTFVQS
jgi:dTDP-4-amino-4,6-dideoxygalactose transaminase